MPDLAVLVDQVRDWTGTEPDAATVEAALARFTGDPLQAHRAALSILLRREADAGPAKWAVAEDYSEDGTEAAKRLAAKIARLRAIVGDHVDTTGLPVVGVAKLAGPGNLR